MNCPTMASHPTDQAALKRYNTLILHVIAERVESEKLKIFSCALGVFHESDREEDKAAVGICDVRPELGQAEEVVL